MVNNSTFKKHILVCTQEACKCRGGEEIFLKIKDRINELGLKPKYRPSRVICIGLCEQGPNILVWPEGETYSNFSEDKIEDLLQKHVLNDE